MAGTSWCYGNKRLAWYASWVFLHLNGHPLEVRFDIDAAERFVLDASQGRLDVPTIAEQLVKFAAMPNSGEHR
ncbi:hypothetical protein [Nocardia callitridis]|uniref:Fido domain-containing protein n=1 Tax=Nocardia callitridis TaxID=648753 RepID=A0ABP9JUP9_9NOCA